MKEELKAYVFWCDEKFVVCHKCINKQLYVIEVNVEEDMEEDLVIADEEKDDVEDSNSYISVHAISGIVSKGYKTIRVTMYVVITVPARLG